MLWASHPASFIFSRLFGSATAEPTLSCLLYVFFSFCPSLPSFPRRVYNTPLFFFALFSSFLRAPRPCPSPPVPGLGPHHNTTVSLMRPVLRLWLLVSRWRRLPSRIFQPTSIITSYSLSSSLFSLMRVCTSERTSPHVDVTRGRKNCVAGDEPRYLFFFRSTASARCFPAWRAAFFRLELAQGLTVSNVK